MKAIDLDKQEAPDADAKRTQQINLSANLDWGGQTAMYFFIKDAKETVFRFFTGRRESIIVLYCFNIISI